MPVRRNILLDSDFSQMDLDVIKSRTYSFSPKHEISINGYLDPYLKITRFDTNEQMILSHKAWQSLFSFEKEITMFFEDENSEFQAWLPIEEVKINIHCYKNYQKEKVLEVRTHVRGRGNLYRLYYSSNQGFIVNGYSWEKLLSLKLSINQSIDRLRDARDIMKVNIVHNLKETLFELSNSCENENCKNSIAHDAKCNEYGHGLNYKERVEQNVIAAIPLLNEEKITGFYLKDYGIDSRINYNHLYLAIVSDIEGLKSELYY